MAVERAQLARPALELAPLLLGATLVSTVGGLRVALRLTEVEAYEGADDPASHAFRGLTPRTEVMFGDAGYLYVYFTYGMHWCANIVAGHPGRASAVLLRAAEVLDGVDVARARRPSARADRDLARGPARLGACVGLSRSDNGTDLCDRDSPIHLVALQPPATQLISAGPRVGISSAGERPWRFWLSGDPSVSAYRAGGRKRTQPDRQTGQP